MPIRFEQLLRSNFRCGRMCISRAYAMAGRPVTPVIPQNLC